MSNSNGLNSIWNSIATSQATKQQSWSAGTDFENLLISVIQDLKNDPALLAIILKNKELSVWYDLYKIKEQKKLERDIKDQRDRELKESALKKLSDEEKKVLGLL